MHEKTTERLIELAALERQSRAIASQIELLRREAVKDLMDIGGSVSVLGITLSIRHISRRPAIADNPEMAAKHARAKEIRKALEKENEDLIDGLRERWFEVERTLDAITTSPERERLVSELNDWLKKNERKIPVIVADFADTI